MDDKDGNVISHLVGDFGKWQATVSLLVSLLKLPIGWFQLSIVFLAPIPEFWCEHPISNVTKFNQVSDVTWRNESLNNCDVECAHYVFNTTTFKRTIISEVNIFELGYSLHGHYAGHVLISDLQSLLGFQTFFWATKVFKKFLPLKRVHFGYKLGLVNQEH